MSAPEFTPDTSKPLGPQVTAYLNDTSHHIKVTAENVDEFVLLAKWQNHPWTILTPRGTYHTQHLCERWIVPRWDGGRDDVFWLDSIIWHSDEDGWVARYVERFS